LRVDAVSRDGDGKLKALLRKLDHGAIFPLSPAPPFWRPLERPVGWTLFGVI
jgi:hypothetical protein